MNQCMSDPGAMAMFATVKPVGGHVLAHASTTRIHLKKGRVSGTLHNSVFQVQHRLVLVNGAKGDLAKGEKRPGASIESHNKMLQLR